MLTDSKITELATSFLNGNKTAVIEQVKKKAATSVKVYKAIAEENRLEAESFLRLLDLNAQ